MSCTAACGNCRWPYAHTAGGPRGLRRQWQLALTLWRDCMAPAGLQETANEDVMHRDIMITMQSA